MEPTIANGHCPECETFTLKINDGLPICQTCEWTGWPDNDCECSEEYGPCEDHCEVIAQREGASTRTADDLAYVFLTDVLAIAEEWNRDPIADQIDTRKLAEAVDYWGDDDKWDDRMGCRWVREDVDAEIHDEIMVGESVLADMGLSVWWEDGYVISRVTGGPLSE